MHEDDRAPNRSGYEESRRPWMDELPVDRSLLYTPIGGTSRRLWRAAFCAGTAFCLASALWTRTPVVATSRDVAATWNVELSSAGAHPVTALVFGKEAGVHLVSIPGTDATPEERRRIPARLAAGNVYMVSLGRSDLHVHTASPPGTPPMAFAAQARFVQLFKSKGGTGIRTSWRSSR